MSGQLCPCVQAYAELLDVVGHPQSACPLHVPSRPLQLCNDVDCPDWRIAHPAHPSTAVDAAAGAQ